jgi:hypothetical protein
MLVGEQVPGQRWSIFDRKCDLLCDPRIESWAPKYVIFNRIGNKLGTVSRGLKSLLGESAFASSLYTNSDIIDESGGNRRPRIIGRRRGDGMLSGTARAESKHALRRIHDGDLASDYNF